MRECCICICVYCYRLPSRSHGTTSNTISSIIINDYQRQDGLGVPYTQIKLYPSTNSFMNVNNSKLLLLFIPAILEHVSRNRTCSIRKLGTHNKKYVITEPSRTPVSPSELNHGFECDKKI